MRRSPVVVSSAVGMSVGMAGPGGKPSGAGRVSVADAGLAAICSRQALARAEASARRMRSGESSLDMRPGKFGGSMAFPGRGWVCPMLETQAVPATSAAVPAAMEKSIQRRRLGRKIPGRGTAGGTVSLEAGGFPAAGGVGGAAWGAAGGSAGWGAVKIVEQVGHDPLVPASSGGTCRRVLHWGQRNWRDSEDRWPGIIEAERRLVEVRDRLGRRGRGPACCRVRGKVQGFRRPE